MKRPQLGFTLIELLIVISIIGMISALLMVNVIGAQQRSRDAQRKSGLKQIQAALEQYKNDNGHYPCSSPSAGWQYSYQSLWITDYASGGTGCGVNGSDMTLSPTYISHVPVDPINTPAGAPWSGSPNGGYYNYAYWSIYNPGSTCIGGGNYYILIGALENANDQSPDTVAQMKKYGGNICGTWYNPAAGVNNSGVPNWYNAIIMLSNS
jgi:prepilin-type N-terminal cleavage/methylation domain-containing protein